MMLNIGLRKIAKAIDIVDFRFLGVRLSRCPLHGKSLFVRLNDSMLGVRCVLCGASPIATCIARVLSRCDPDFQRKTIYELSARGAFFEYLRQNTRNLVFSEYLDNVHPGEISRWCNVSGCATPDIR